MESRHRPPTTTRRATVRIPAGQDPPTEMPEQMSKEEAKKLLAEIEVQIKENKI